MTRIPIVAGLLFWLLFIAFTAVAYGYFFASFGGVHGFKTWLLRRMGMSATEREREAELRQIREDELESRLRRDVARGRTLGERKR